MTYYVSSGTLNTTHSLTHFSSTQQLHLISGFEIDPSWELPVCFETNGILALLINANINKFGLHITTFGGKTNKQYIVRSSCCLGNLNGNNDDMKITVNGHNCRITFSNSTLTMKLRKYSYCLYTKILLFTSTVTICAVPSWWYCSHCVCIKYYGFKSLSIDFICTSLVCAAMTDKPQQTKEQKTQWEVNSWNCAWNISSNSSIHIFSGIVSN